MNKTWSIVLASSLIIFASSAKAESKDDSAANKIPSAESIAISDMIALKPPEPLKGGCKMFPGLKLTDEQMEKVVELQLKAKKTALPLKAELMELKYELGKVMTASAIDKEKARAIHEQIGEKMKALAGIRFDIMLEMSDNMTDEQKKKVKHRMLKHELMTGGMDFMQGPGMFPPPPPGPGFMGQAFGPPFPGPPFPGPMPPRGFCKKKDRHQGE